MAQKIFVWKGKAEGGEDRGWMQEINIIVGQFSLAIRIMFLHVAFVFGHSWVVWVGWVGSSLGQKIQEVQSRDRWPPWPATWVLSTSFACFVTLSFVELDRLVKAGNTVQPSKLGCVKAGRTGLCLAGHSGKSRKDCWAPRLVATFQRGESGEVAQAAQ